MCQLKRVTHADDGFLSASDLEKSLGSGADVKQMIAAADKNGDGKVQQTPFLSLLCSELPYLSAISLPAILLDQSVVPKAKHGIVCAHSVFLHRLPCYLSPVT